MLNQFEKYGVEVRNRENKMKVMLNKKNSRKIRDEKEKLLTQENSAGKKKHEENVKMRYGEQFIHVTEYTEKLWRN